MSHDVSGVSPVYGLVDLLTIARPHFSVMERNPAFLLYPEPSCMVLPHFIRPYAQFVPSMSGLCSVAVPALATYLWDDSDAMCTLPHELRVREVAAFRHALSHFTQMQGDAFPQQILATPVLTKRQLSSAVDDVLLAIEGAVNVYRT